MYITSCVPYIGSLDLAPLRLRYYRIAFNLDPGEEFKLDNAMAFLGHNLEQY